MSEKTTISDADRNAIYAAYDRIKEEQGGVSAVSVGRLARESGVELSKVQEFLVSEAQAKNDHRVDLHSRTVLWDKLSAEDRTGAFRVPYRPEPIVTAMIRGRIPCGDNVPEQSQERQQKEFSARDREVMREVKR